MRNGQRRGLGEDCSCRVTVRAGHKSKQLPGYDTCHFLSACGSVGPVVHYSHPCGLSLSQLRAAFGFGSVYEAYAFYPVSTHCVFW